MKFKIQFLIIILLLFSLSCSEKSVTPPDEERPPGYQEDIPWPSLADSPWPMNHHDPQSTGRSKYIGPIAGDILWKFPASGVYTSITINSDSLLFLAPSNEPQGLLALSERGIKKWNVPLGGMTGEVQTTPLINDKGIIFIAAGDGKLSAFDELGNNQWTFQTENSIWIKGINIGLDREIYFVDMNKNLKCIDANGNLLWSFYSEMFNPYANVSISFSPDGKDLYIPGESVSLISFNLELKKINWTFGNSSLQAAPVVDNESNIYINSICDTLNSGKPTLYSLRKDGMPRWAFVHSNSDLIKYLMDPTIDWNGTIYFAYDTLYSINYSGELNWKVALSGICESPIISDVQNNIYVPIISGNSGEFVKFNNQGNVLWSVPLNFPDHMGFSPVINSDGTIYLVAWNGTNIYAIK
jgi:hypothetical protein